MEQKIITADNNYEQVGRWISDNQIKSLLLVCDGSIGFLKEINDYLLDLEEEIRITRFDKFTPNPLYDSVVIGVEIFKLNNCNGIFAIGGGSAIDVAKCIKLYSNMDPGHNYLEQKIIANDLPFLAMPTTAGTGSESTKYAVIYYEGKKQSVTHESCIPGTVLLDPGCLKTLPSYQKKSTMMDALCHALESFWSVNSTEESKEYSRRAIRLVMKNMDGYLNNTEEGNEGMLLAANTAGKAINITQTTAGHAMCYKITSLFGCSHGHAAILCDRVLFPWMLDNIDLCIDARGKDYLYETFNEIAETMGCDTPEQAATKLNDIFNSLGLDIPLADVRQFEELRTSVNPVRLKNHPVMLTEESIDKLYHKILIGE